MMTSYRVLVRATVILHVSLVVAVPVQAQRAVWSHPINLRGVVNSWSSEIQVAMTHSGLSLYIVSDRPGGYGANDIWVSHRGSQSAPWSEPENLGRVINSPGNDSGPNFSPDDHWMFFASPRSGTFGGSDIWVSYRDDASDDFGWQDPVNLGPNINTSAPEVDPFYFVDPTTARRHCISPASTTRMVQVTGMSFAPLRVRTVRSGPPYLSPT